MSTASSPHSKFSDREMQKTYDTLLKKAIVGDKEALAGLNVLIQNTTKSNRYSLIEDIRQTAYEQYLNQKTPSSIKNKILRFFSQFSWRS